MLSLCILTLDSQNIDGWSVTYQSFYLDLLSPFVCYCFLDQSYVCLCSVKLKLVGVLLYSS